MAMSFPLPTSPLSCFPCAGWCWSGHRHFGDLAKEKLSWGILGGIYVVHSHFIYKVTVSCPDVGVAPGFLQPYPVPTCLIL